MNIIKSASDRVDQGEADETSTVRKEHSNTHDALVNINYIQNTNIEIGVSNVCGLKRRSVFPEFTELVGDFDLFLEIETKHDCTRLWNGYRPCYPQWGILATIIS